MTENVKKIDKAFILAGGKGNRINLGQKENIKALHYTDGGPWHPGYENTPFAKEWLEWITDNEKNRLIKETGVKL